MIRAFAVIVTLSLTLGAAAPLLCELDCLSHASHSQSQHCHDQVTGPALSAASGVCDHALAGANSGAVATKATASQEWLGTPPASPLTIGAASLPPDHASGPPDRIVQPQFVLRTVLRI